MTDADLHVGPVDDPDRYLLNVPVGAGAEGVLYKAQVFVGDHMPLQVAVKMLHPNHRVRLREWTERWSDQVELLRSLQLPGVVTVREGFVGALPHHAGDSDPGASTLYVVMNWVEGMTLDAWLDQNPDASPAERLKTLLPVAAALDIMHTGHATGGTPVIHGDIKPSNIVIRESGESVLVDFGLLRLLPGGEKMTGVSGTPGYVAPEVVREGRYTAAADRYSLGAVAYFLLAHEEPRSDDSLEVVSARLDQLEYGGHELASHVTKMLSPEPGLRPAVLANWCAEMRSSSLDPQLQPDVLPPVALNRLPDAATKRPGSGAGEGRPWLRRAAVVALLVIVAVGVPVGVEAISSNGPPRHPERLVAANHVKSRSAAITTTTTTSPPPTTTSSVPVVKTLGATAPPTTATATCYNSFLGYQITIPASLVASPATNLTGNCEEFEFTAVQAPASSSGLLTQSIVFAMLPEPESTYLAAVQAFQPTEHSETVAGYAATTIDYANTYAVAGSPFPDGSVVYTYLVDLGKAVLAAQLALPTSQAAQASTDMHTLDTIMSSLEFRASSICVSSTDPRCGPFYYNPAPPPLQPMTVTVSMSPQQPMVGQPESFSVETSDPQDDVINQNFAGYGDTPGQPETSPGAIDTVGLLSVVRSRSTSPTPAPQGEWPPPPPVQGTAPFIDQHTYATPGTFTVTLEFDGSDSAATPGADPYLNSTSCTFQVVVAASSALGSASTTPVSVPLSCAQEP